MPRLSWSVTLSQSSLVFHDLDSPKLSPAFSVVFLMVRLGLQAFGKETKTWSALLVVSHRGEHYLHDDNLGAHCHHLVRTVFARILHCEVTHFPYS